MGIYTISDLHLSGGVEKPMDIFGGAWINHAERVTASWLQTISDEDYVVLPGDHSWGLTEEEALPDLKWINGLPGRKILLKGNHDLWWQTGRKLQRMKEAYHLDSLTFLHNSAVFLPEYHVAVCGTRGWKCPGDKEFSTEDQRVYRREVLRLETSLKCGSALSPAAPELIAFLHYPPYNRNVTENGFTETLKRYHVRYCYYGHLHGPAQRNAVNGTENADGIVYTLVSCDYTGHRLCRVR